MDSKAILPPNSTAEENFAHFHAVDGFRSAQFRVPTPSPVESCTTNGRFNMKSVFYLRLNSQVESLVLYHSPPHSKQRPSQDFVKQGGKLTTERRNENLSRPGFLNDLEKKNDKTFKCKLAATRQQRQQCEEADPPGKVEKTTNKKNLTAPAA